MQSIVALVGKKGSGKTTIAHHLRTRGFIEVSFADTLKDSLCVLLGIPRDVFDNPGSKETLFHVGGRHLTPRAILQTYGDVVKSPFGSEVFIEAVARRIREIGSLSDIIISDVRFPAEANFVRELGARLYRVVPSDVVRINRSPWINPDLQTTTGSDQHASETHQETIQCDTVIENDGRSRDVLFAALDTEFRCMDTVENRCIQCGTDLGINNPRQLCGKTVCDSESMF